MATKEKEDETGDGNTTGFNVNLIDTIANDLQEAMHNPPPGVIEIMALIGSLLGPPFNTFKPSVSIDDDEKQYYENIKHNAKQMKKHFSSTSKKILVALKHNAKQMKKHFSSTFFSNACPTRLPTIHCG